MKERILPIENITLRSPLSADEVIAKITDITEPTRLGFSFKKYLLQYNGKVYQDHFLINRNLNYRNSFAPEIKGEIEPERNGSLILIKFRLHQAVLVFIAFFAFVCLVFLGTFIYLIAKNGWQWEILIPIGMLFFLYTMVYFGFFTEVDRTKDDLQKLLNATEISER